MGIKANNWNVYNSLSLFRSKYRITYVPDERTLLFKAANGNLNAVTLKKVEVLDDKMKGSDGLKCVARINATEYYEFVFDDKSTAERFIYMMRG